MMDTAPLISVCIANYNGMEVIDDCLRSVLGQQGGISVEILVHDDASTDASVAHIREHYPEVVLIESDTNVGFCIANNRMMTRARGKFILLLNNDAALFADALQTLLTEAVRLAQPAILTLPQFDATTGVLVDRGCLLDPFYNPVPNLNPNRADVAMVIGACLWIPKTLWDELEGFPEWFGSIAEDMYLCCRARLAGYAVRALAASGYRHWQGKSFGGNRVQQGRLSTNVRRRYMSERNKIYTLIATYPPYILWIALCIHLALSLLESLLLGVIKKNYSLVRRIYFAAWKDVIHELPILLHLRKRIAKRTVITFCKQVSVFYPIHRKIHLLFRHGIPSIR